MTALRTFVAALCTFALFFAVGIALVVLGGCGNDGARCSTVVDSEDGDSYRVCRAGDHVVSYELDESGKPIERPDGTVSYSEPGE